MAPPYQNPSATSPHPPATRILAPFPGPVPSPAPRTDPHPRLHLMLCSLIAHSSHSFATPVLSPTPSSREERGRKGGIASPQHTTTACVSLYLVPALFSPFHDLPSFFPLRQLTCTLYYMPPRTSLLSGFTLQSPRTLLLLPFASLFLSSCSANSVDLFSLILPSCARAHIFVCMLTNRYMQVSVIFFKVCEVGFYNAPVEASQPVASFFMRLILVLSDTDTRHI